MAFGNDWLVSCDLWNLGEWRQALSPGRMFGGHLSDNFGVFLRNDIHEGSAQNSVKFAQHCTAFVHRQEIKWD